MKVFDISQLNGLILAKAEPCNNIPDIIRDEAQRVLRLMSLLEQEYISEEILAIPEIEWDIEEHLCALEDGTTEVASYILANEEKNSLYRHYFWQFRAAPLPKPQEFV